MNDESALIRAMIARPDDDLPRLVYADWLDDHGQHERAEFVRLQIELARSPNHPDRSQLLAREADLLKTHERAWATINALCLFFEWRRGFVAALHPAARGVFDGEDSFRILAEFPLAEELDTGFCMTDADFRHMPDLPNLRSLRLGGNVRITHESVRRISRWRTLRRLSLTGREITDTALPPLAGLTELLELDLSYSGITDDGLIHLVGLKSRESLDVSESHVSGRGLRVLGELPRLRRLNLVNTDYFDPGLDGLDRCRSLEVLHLGSWNLLQAVADTDLPVLGRLPSLRVLSLGPWTDPLDEFVEAVRQHLPTVELRFD